MTTANKDHLTFNSLLEQGWFAPKIAAWLDGPDAIRFSSTSRGSRVVRLQPPLNLETSFEEYGPHDVYHAKVWQELPPLLSSTNKPHTVFLRCRWRDQGWGNMKGMLSVVANGGRAPNDYKPCSDFVVCSKNPAPHEWSPLSLSFRPDTEKEEKDPYSVWVRIGGGGGHQLLVENFRVRVLTYTNGE